MSFVLRSRSRTPQDLLVDAAVHFVKANGKGSPKVFKLKRIVLPPRAQEEIQTRISLAVHTTRKPRPGVHVVDVLVNGVAIRAGTFDVIAGQRSRKKG
jgi:hypothetical protein